MIDKYSQAAAERDGQYVLSGFIEVEDCNGRREILRFSREAIDWTKYYSGEEMYSFDKEEGPRFVERVNGVLIDIMFAVFYIVLILCIIGFGGWLFRFLFIAR